MTRNAPTRPRVEEVVGAFGFAAEDWRRGGLYPARTFIVGAFAVPSTPLPPNFALTARRPRPSERRLGNAIDVRKLQSGRSVVVCGRRSLPARNSTATEPPAAQPWAGVTPLGSTTEPVV